MKSGMDFTGFGKICVVGGESRNFVSFVKKLGMSDILSDVADVVVLTDGKCLDNMRWKKAAFPYFRGFEKTGIICGEVLTYAVEENEADVVVKNVRFTDDFTAFELLAKDGIGRIYLNDTGREAPRYAIALACGLILLGMPFRDVLKTLSRNDIGLK